MGWPARVALALFVAVFLASQWSPEVPASPVGDKLAHAALYYVLGLALWSLLPRGDPLIRAACVVSIGLLLGILMEAGQGRLPTRSPDPLDIVADVLGIAVAAAPLAWAALDERRR